MYLVYEIQTLANGQIATLSYQYSDLNEAYAKFHTILATAAVSALPVHAAVILNNYGTVVDSKYWRHEPSAAPEV